MRVINTFVVISLVLRMGAAPQLCAHEKIYVSDNVSTGFDHCQNMNMQPTMNHPDIDNQKKHVPCKHMKQCLLEPERKDSVFQKSPNSIIMLYALYVPALSRDLIQASSETLTYTSPPEMIYSMIPVYLDKSSFLI